MVIIDTDILIWLLRGDKEVDDKFRAVVTGTDGEVFITPVQAAEIYSGIRPRKRVKTDFFMEAFNFIDIDRAIGRLAGDFINRYGKSHNVTMSDALVGAAARTKAFKLWTLNRKHYPMFEERDFV